MLLHYADGGKLVFTTESHFTSQNILNAIGQGLIKNVLTFCLDKHGAIYTEHILCQIGPLLDLPY